MKSPVVLVDMAVERRSPAGSCVRLQALALCRDRVVHVVTGASDLPTHPNLHVSKVRLPVQPVLLRYLVFQWQARRVMRRLMDTLPEGTQVQCTQGQWPGSHVSYAHFCHTAYLNGGWSQTGVGFLRTLARWLNHRFNAWTEARTFAQADAVVVPSQGLATRLIATFPALLGRVTVVANPVDVSSYERPPSFDRVGQRAELGLRSDALVFCFVALGNFEHKGLGLLISALGVLPPEVRERIQCLVVGGQPGEIESYRALGQAKGVNDHLVFAGLQRDVRPYLWSSDAFALPSAYETFSLAVLQASAAGLPVLVSDGLHGTEDYVRNGEEGWFVHRSIEGVADGLLRAIRDYERLPQMSRQSIDAIQKFSEPAFQAAWTEFYASR
ncbi:glycosyltransferase family 4 protein [Roseateles sp.]|uniref:glycosyltransferase family 4 protein n=1 Tax=Roseateles sp. TaxID=1971397 RepID=UPI003BA43B04